MKRIFIKDWGRMPGNSQRKSHYLWTGSSFMRFPKECQTGRYGLKKELAGEVPAYKDGKQQRDSFRAASFDYPDLQRLLLEEEGVEVSMDNQVDLKQYGWKNTLEEAEAFAEEFCRLKI